MEESFTLAKVFSPCRKTESKMSLRGRQWLAGRSNPANVLNPPALRATSLKKGGNVYIPPLSKDSAEQNNYVLFCERLLGGVLKNPPPAPPLKREGTKLYPRPLREREDFLSEQSELRKSGEGFDVKSPFIPLYKGGKEARQLGSEAAKHSDNISFAQQTEKVYSPLTTHYSLCKKAAFTLAEVLITLGIIGVVAAMTLPVLIQNHKKSETTARLKKFYSNMQQAILLSTIDNGPLEDWDKAANMTNEELTQAGTSNYQVTLEYFNKYLKNYLKYIKTEKDEKTEYLKVIMSDGSTVLIKNGNCIDFIFDVNGDKKPNKTGRDRFIFLICKKAYSVTNRNFSGYIRTKDAKNNRSVMLKYCKETPRYCSALLELDNWEFKNDYPYRL